jgi:hypothetical protein
LKTKRSLASWLVIAGAFFTPIIIIVARLAHYKQLPEIYRNPGFWNVLWHSCWESMAIFLLPFGLILATTLLTQLEFKNNSWKQVHVLPLTYTTIFTAKILVILLLVLQFFILFNLGYFLAAWIPYLLVSNVAWPLAEIPFTAMLRENGYFFIDSLPILALQFLISLKFKNFLIPIGVGFVFWLTALGTLSWKYGYWMPYSYGMYNFLKQNSGRAATPEMNIHWMALGYTVFFTIISYILYIGKKEKG